MRRQEAQEVRQRRRRNIAAGSVENDQAGAQRTRLLQVSSHHYFNATQMLLRCYLSTEDILESKFAELESIPLRVPVIFTAHCLQ